MSISRRSLLRNAGGVGASSVLGDRAWTEMLQQRAHLILHNANIITIDPRQPRAEVIAGKRIVAVERSRSFLILSSEGSSHVMGKNRFRHGAL